MKFLCIAFVAIMSACRTNADVSFTRDEVMCNCKTPYNKMYTAYQNASTENCKNFPTGTAGQASCIASALGYLQNDGRTFNHDAIAKDFENLPFVASCDPKLPEISAAGGAWQWHGNFNYAEMDKSIATYFDCIGKSMEADCNTQLVDKVRSCNSAN